MSEKIVQLNEEVIKGQLKELVRGSVEETLFLFYRSYRNAAKILDEHRPHYYIVGGRGIEDYPCRGQRL